MKRSGAFVCAALLLPAASSARGAAFFDDFEHGVSRNVSGGTWSKFPGGTEYLLGDSSHNHTPGGIQSARAYEANPWIYNSYADFGATADSIRATVYLFEDKNYVPPYQFPYIKVTNMFSLWGDSATGPSAATDYIELGIVPSFPGGGSTYGFRTKFNDDHALGYVDTGVPRADSQWLKLTIEADSMAAGGVVRFYLDDALVGSSYRTGPNLRWVMLGGTTYTYENFWYDDVSVISTPTLGDFDSDGDVDGADFIAWQTHFPKTNDAQRSDGDADADGDVDNTDFLAWQSNFANHPVVVATPIPEPAAANLICNLVLIALLMRYFCSPNILHNRRERSYVLV